MSRKAIDILQKAKNLNPEDPRPDKYLAIANVDAYYQYDTALKSLNAYIEKVPEDVFGHTYKGYILFQMGRDTEAVASFETALSLMPEDTCYLHYYLSRSYFRLFKNAADLSPRRKTYETRFQEHADFTRSYRDTYPLRVDMLNRWIDGME
jgi:tetratricopeptide (TPR) repeat protein